MTHRCGKVSLVGAGPGDPELLTLRALRLLRTADVIVYDALVDERVLEHRREGAELLYAGKRCGKSAMPQEAINSLLVRLARAGKEVVRLKGGDPFVFGRGGEEALALADAGIEFEIVPGVTSGVAVPASAGIPVTHRGVARAVTFVTGHGADSTPDWSSIARAPGTIVVFMGLTSLRTIAAELIAGGRAATTPVAVIANGTREDQRTVIGTLETIAADVERAALPSPALLVIGEVVALHHQLAPGTKEGIRIPTA